MNAWLKRCVFNLDLNRESVSEPRTFSGRLFHSLGARYEKVLPLFVDFAILGSTSVYLAVLIYSLNISRGLYIVKKREETQLFRVKQVFFLSRCLK